MSNQTNDDGWEDVPEFDAEQAQIERNKEDRAIYADIKRREDQ